jgi:hypothetical protein
MKCYWELLSEHIGNLGNTLGIYGNTMKTEKKPKTLPSPRFHIEGTTPDWYILHTSNFRYIKSST